MILSAEIQPLTDFVTGEEIQTLNVVTYNYEGICPQTGEKLLLPRTLLAEKVALTLSRQLHLNGFYTKKGKMLGILVVRDKEANLGVIKAFSGFLNGEKNLQGWVGQISGYNLISLAENLTLKQLETIKDEIISLQNLTIRQDYDRLKDEYQRQWQELKAIHGHNKEMRDKKRFYYQNSSEIAELILVITLSFSFTIQEKQTNNRLIYNLLLNIHPQNKLYQLEQESRRDDWERRRLKHRWQEILKPLEDQINHANQQIVQLKQQRKELSKHLQAQMQTAYTLTNFAGNSLSIGSLLGKPFIPTGTGDCCAPKLLHYAATHNLQPLAMAEFWWGESSPNGERQEGNFYPPCLDRCQPLMGFLLSGLPNTSTLHQSSSPPIIYEDEYLVVVNKPSGLLSVSGRGSHNFYSVESYFRQISTAKSNFQITTVHRLDQDTSGILILAKTKDCYINLSQQFAQRRIKKVYETIVNGIVIKDKGTIDLPLWSNPEKRPYQEVNYQYGKPSLTDFRVLERYKNTTRLELNPLTGRTHQLRVHCLRGLGYGIKGDRLYGDDGQDRLYLHAREIIFTHPISQKEICLSTDTPF